MSEYNRRGRRTPSSEVCKIKLGLFKRIPCEVKDLSPGGARLILPKGVEVPEKFSVKLPQFKRTRNCVRRWQDGNMIGVEFSV